jgi:plastocyanin
MNGFLGTGATFWADLNLIVQLAMGTALLIGMVLARHKQFRAHMFCQSSVMLLNLAMIFLVMLPSFRRQVEPQIPDGLSDAYYLVATLHAGLGAIAELLGLYIVLRAATKLLPESLRFQNYKAWMRTELALWWVVVLIGLGTYYIWYLAPAPTDQTQASAAASPSLAAVSRVTIKITNFAFQPKELAIPAGTTVEWIDELGRHTVQADDGSFKSDTLAAGGRFEHKFEQPGVFNYYCQFHGDQGGQEMAGVITVTPRAK